MISAADFKKHISKQLGHNMRNLGFRGSGFNYIMESENFIFTFGIQASQYGGNCCAEFGIQPKTIDYINGHKLDFKKLKYFNCELRDRLARPGKGDMWWTYAKTEEKNVEIANDIFALFYSHAFPIFNAFQNEPDILDKIEASDLENCYKSVGDKLHGITPLFGDTRFAWVMMKYHEKKDIAKSIEFAKHGLSTLSEDSIFFGKKDFEEAIKSYGA